MASVSIPVSVPIVAKLRCLPCTDRAIEGDGDLSSVPDAFTLAPLAQVFNVAGQQIAAINVVPVCAQCRTEQVAKANSRLAIA